MIHIFYKILVFLIFFSTFPSLAKTQETNNSRWYWGFGILSSDFSDWTVADSEASSLNFSKLEQEPKGYTIFTGLPLNKNSDFELAFESHGEQHTIGAISGATLDSKVETYSITPSIIIKPENKISGILPFIRFGFAIGLTQANSSKTNAFGVFQNPHNTSEARISSNLVYSVGLEYDYNNSTSVRLDYKVNNDAQTDYINNIDNGYIKKDFTSLGINLVFKTNNNVDKKAPKIKSGYDIGLFRGISQTKSRMSGGSYSGNIYNLTTGNVASTVTGSMFDDKKDVVNRLMLILPPKKNFGYDFSLAQYGIFKSKSSARGITGGGNAVTGAASRSITSLEGSLNYPMLIKSKFMITPTLGMGVFYVEDEIYNNLEFDGVGGNARGPKSTSTELNFIMGIMGRYKLSEDLDLAIRHQVANNVGNSAGLGKGNLVSTSIGIISKF